MNTPNPDLGLTYERVSTDRQDVSLEAQERRLAAYGQLRGLEFPPGLMLGDPDTSGSVPFAERPGGARVLHHLEHGWQGREVRHLVVTKVDRLGRNAADLLGLLEWMKQRGRMLHVIDFFGEPITNQGIVGKVMFGMVALFAEMEVERIRERIHESFAERRAQGRITSGTVPFGWRLVMPDGSEAVPAGDATGRKRWPSEARLVEHPVELFWVRQIHAWRRAGWTMVAIASALNGAGIRTKTGLEWKRSTVERLLERPEPAAEPAAVAA